MRAAIVDTGPLIARSLAASVAQTFLRVLGIDIAFSREGRAGSRIIRIGATQENTVSTVSSVRDNVHRNQPVTSPMSSVGPRPIGRHRRCRC
jgi:hypothetical protein